MNREQFNKKYERYIEEGFDGLEFDNPKVIEFLDSEFKNIFVDIKDFQFAQIKLKFGQCRFYSNLSEIFGSDIGREMESSIEDSVDSIIKYEC